MKVKIVKASSEAYWYASRISYVFDVEEVKGDNDWYCKEESGWIGRDDCVLVGDSRIELFPPTQQFRIMRQKKPGKKYKTRGTILHSVDEAKSLLKQLQENFPQYKYILVEIIEGDMDV